MSVSDNHAKLEAADSELSRKKMLIPEKSRQTFDKFVFSSNVT